MWGHVVPSDAMSYPNSTMLYQVVPCGTMWCHVVCGTMRCQTCGAMWHHVGPRWTNVAPPGSKQHVVQRGVPR
eukprot:6878611-Lingulodinium_polyedra.AAC.1